MCKVINLFSREVIPEVTELETERYENIISKYREDKESIQHEVSEVVKTETELGNKYCSICFEGDSVDGRDLTDRYNEPAFYTRNKRSIKKGWKDLTESFNAETKMYDAMGILNKYNLKCHSYCMMD